MFKCFKNKHMCEQRLAEIRANDLKVITVAFIDRMYQRDAQVELLKHILEDKHEQLKQLTEEINRELKEVHGILKSMIDQLYMMFITVNLVDPF